MLKHSPKIESEMVPYRLGLAPLPKSYVEFHRTVAISDLARRGWDLQPGSVRMENDGFLDSMTVLSAVLYTGHRIKWHESGAWFRQPEGGSGWYRWMETVLSQDEVDALTA